MITLLIAYLMYAVVFLLLSQLDSERDPFSERALAMLFGPVVRAWPLLLVATVVWLVGYLV